MDLTQSLVVLAVVRQEQPERCSCAALRSDGIAATRTLILHVKPRGKRVAGLNPKEEVGHGAKRSHQEQTPAKISNGRPGDLLWTHTTGTERRASSLTGVAL